MRCEPTRGAHATHCTHNIKELHKYLSFNFSISNIKAAKITQRASWAAPDLRAHPARPLGAVASPGAEMGGVTRPALRSAGELPSALTAVTATLDTAREAVSGNSSRCCTGLARFAEPSRLRRKGLNGLVLRRRQSQRGRLKSYQLHFLDKIPQEKPRS